MAIRLAHNWWALAARGLIAGLVAIVFGILAFAWPGITLFTILYLFGIYVILDGILALLAAFAGPRDGNPWWALMLEGVAGIALGLLTFAQPVATGMVILYLIAFWAVATGLLEIVAAFRLRQHIEGEWALALSGVLSIAFGVLVMLNPGAGALALLWVFAAYAILFGVTLLAVSWRLRRWGRERGVGWGSVIRPVETKTPRSIPPIF